MSSISLFQKLRDVPTSALNVWEDPRVFKWKAEGIGKKVAAVICELYLHFRGISEAGLMGLDIASFDSEQKEFMS